MAARFLLDTDICIYIRRKRPPEVLAKFRQLKSAEAVLSVVTYAELVYGIEKMRAGSPGYKQLDELLALAEIMPLPVEAGRKYGEIRALLESKGQMIGNNDLWIGAHALSADLTVVTNNEREFRRIPGLRVQNWLE